MKKETKYCDRCGKEIKTTELYPLLKIKKEIVCTLGNYADRNFFHNYKEFDLCNECAGELENWLKSPNKPWQVK